MAFTYGRHYLTIGPFQDSKYIVNMLAKCANAGERDHLVFFLILIVAYFRFNSIFYHLFVNRTL